mmetsp:Transcript_61245/g.145792  ORF Transcript_61245/g.145792 Transcript_61245/m.145792 type:complete len:205 (-) Transcript_61245:321-935(-)
MRSGGQSIATVTAGATIHTCSSTFTKTSHTAHAGDAEENHEHDEHHHEPQHNGPHEESDQVEYRQEQVYPNAKLHPEPGPSNVVTKPIHVVILAKYTLPIATNWTAHAPKEQPQRWPVVVTDCSLAAKGEHEHSHGDKENPSIRKNHFHFLGGPNRESVHDTHALCSTRHSRWGFITMPKILPCVFPSTVAVPTWHWARGARYA